MRDVLFIFNLINRKTAMCKLFFIIEQEEIHTQAIIEVGVISFLIFISHLKSETDSDI